MGDEVRMYGARGSPFTSRVEIALNLKGIKYKNLEEDLKNKSADVIKYNPVHKKLPVLVHNGYPISESIVIIEYIDDVWKGIQIMPHDPYEKALARFWAKFIDDKIIPSIYAVLLKRGEDEQAVVEACDQLQMLENELEMKGKKYFGGDNINLVDIAGAFIAYWVGIIEEAAEIELITKDRFPKITEWAHNFVNYQVVREVLPPRDFLFAELKKRFGKA